MPWMLCTDERTGKKWLVRARNAAEARAKLYAVGVSVGSIVGWKAWVHCDRAPCRKLLGRNCSKIKEDIIELGGEQSGGR